MIVRGGVKLTTLECSPSGRTMKPARDISRTTPRAAPVAGAPSRSQDFHASHEAEAANFKPQGGVAARDFDLTLQRLDGDEPLSLALSDYAGRGEWKLALGPGRVAYRSSSRKNAPRAALRSGRRRV